MQFNTKHDKHTQTASISFNTTGHMGAITDMSLRFRDSTVDIIIFIRLALSS